MANFSVPFMLDFPYNDEIEEFDITFNHLEDNQVDLLKFLETYSNRRVNILLDALGIDIELVKLMYKVNPNIHLKLSEGYIPKIEQYQEEGIPFYFVFPASSWDMLHSLIKVGVSDIYITGEMGFCLYDIQKLTNPLGINLRAYVNIAQGEDITGKENNRLKFFYIRPEDIEEYSQVIDSFEIFYDNDKKKIKPLYEVYNHKQNWFGDLSEIIFDLNMKLDSRRLLPEFGGYRINCGKRCYKGSGCRRCERIKKLADVMEDKDIILKRVVHGSE